MERWNKRVFFGILAVVFVAMLALNFVTPLEADDYSYMYHFGTGERFQSLSQLVPSALAHYQVMNGRMVTNSLFAQIMMLCGKTAFNLINAGVYLVFTLGLYLFLRGETKRDWMLMLAVQGAVFLFAPAFGVTTLWVDGACNYLWGTTLIVYALLPFRNAFLEGKNKLPLWKQIGLALVALMAGNVTENTSLVMILLMGLCVLWSAARQKQVPLWMPVMLLMAVAGYAVLMGSPVTGKSVGSEPSLGRYLVNFSLCMTKFLEQKGLLCAYAVLACLSWKEKEDRQRLWLSLALVAGALIANAAMVIPKYYPERASFGWVVLLLLACGLLAPSLKRVQAGALWRGVAASLAGIAVIVFLQAAPLVYDRYCQAEARLADIATQKAAGVTDIETYGIRSRTRYDIYGDGNTFSGSAKYRPNVCFAKACDVGSIRLTDELN